MARCKKSRSDAAASSPLIGTPVLLNGDKQPTQADPHSRLPLLGDPAGVPGPRIMWGVLRRRYRGFENGAQEYLAAKLRPSWSADPMAATAARVEALAPPAADDSFADPWLLAARLDREIAHDAEGKTALFGYATITDPQAGSIHGFWEELREVSRRLVEAHGAPVVAVVHAPGRAGSGNALHGHLLICPYKVNKLGFGARIGSLCGDRGREVVVRAWHDRRRFA